MPDGLSFRWLGVQGLELSCAGQSLAIDPFFTRPPFRSLLLGRVQPNRALAARLLARCDYVLVTHPHYDHILDVPDLLMRSGASAYGSPNAAQILALAGVPSGQAHVIRPGDTLNLGPFAVEVFANRHIRLPVDPLINGPLRAGLRFPLRLRDYRMDCSFGFYIQAAGLRILFCPGPARPADLLFTGVWKDLAYYRTLLAEVRPKVLLPLHWDNFFRPLDRPLRELAVPSGMSLARLAHLVAATAPATKFLIPQLFQWVRAANL
jgi:hypothetical protein